MMRRKHWVIAVLVLLCIGCKTNDEPEITLSSDQECVVVGNVKGLGNGILELEDEFGDYAVIAKGEIRRGKFIIRTEVLQPTFVVAYAVKGESERQVRYFFLEPGIVHVTGSFRKDQDNGAVGTPTNDYWQEFKKEIRQGDPDDSGEVGRRYYRNAPTDIFRLWLLDDHDTCWSSSEKLALIQAMDPEVRSMTGVSDMQDLFTRRAKVEPNGENVYIDIEQPDPEGNMVSLKEVVEKPGNRYVLLDFWATWCGPCREEMPFVKEAYDRFHGKGFDIYAVSLDNGDNLMARWRKYIVDKELPWTNVCSGEYTRSQAYQDYALKGIPDNVLIDCADGRIIARSLRGEDLADKLSELLD
jgi:thiol-disulfide isomerase/thioredoxin